MLTEIQRIAFNALMSGDNIFLTGEAGTGKSYLLNTFLETSRRNRRNIVVCAPTGIAAVNVNGATLHRVFNLPMKPLKSSDEPKKINDVILYADCIIIDEISMCRSDVFDYVVRYIIKAESESGVHKQIIVVGDFFQLPPVVTDKERNILGTNFGDGYAFMSKMWNKLNFKTIKLDDVVRQTDKEFIDNLNKIRVGNTEGIRWINTHSSKVQAENAIYLCGMNKQAKNLNESELSKLTTPEKHYISDIKGNVSDQEKATDDDLVLKVGAQVMFLTNDADDAYQNGSIGKVVECNPKSVVVNVKGKNVKVIPYTWEISNYKTEMDPITRKSVVKRTVEGTFRQIPLKLAYAITIHKSQGQTFENVNLYPYCFSNGQLYVALSRVKSASGLFLMEQIKPRSLITSPTVQDFYESIGDYSDDYKDKEHAVVEPTISETLVDESSSTIETESGTKIKTEFSESDNLDDLVQMTFDEEKKPAVVMMEVPAELKDEIEAYIFARTHHFKNMK